MKSINDLVIMTDLTRQALYHRLRELGLNGPEVQRHYEPNKEGKIERVFQKDEVKKIINYVGKKPGRKRTEK